MIRLALGRNSAVVPRQSLLVEAIVFLSEFVVLCFPAVLNAGPIVYPDTRAYYLGGRAAVDKLRAVFERHVGGVGADTIDGAIQKARGVRSAFYSLYTYVVADAVSLWLVIGLQAVLVVLVLRLTFDLMCPQQPRWQRTLFIMLVAVATTSSWTVSIVMPDVFTPVLVLAVILIMLFWQQLGQGNRYALLLTISASMVMHMTNLPIALGLLVCGTLLKRHLLVAQWRRYLMIGGALGFGVSAMLAVGVLGFRQWTLTPQSPPFLLARSLSDGPGKLYLRDHCPEINLAMCRHLDHLDEGTEIFLWDKNGGYLSVSSDEASQIRKEDKQIYLAAALEHPWMQVRAMAQNAFRQLVLFTLHEYAIPSSADYTATDMTLNFVDPPRSGLPLWQTIVSVPEYMVVLASLVYGLAAWQRGKLTRDQRDFFLLVLATVLIEALAGAFSEPAPRYEARVVWLLPMAALLFHFSQLNRRRS